MKAGNKKTGVRLRVVLAPDVAIGPGKADLLDGIERSGSIAAAGRALGMSYKRAWTLIEAMNGQFAHPVVETSRGGRARGGAQLTPLGRKILDLYRKMETETQSVIRKDVAAMRRLLPPGKK